MVGPKLHQQRAHVRAPRLPERLLDVSKPPLDRSAAGALNLLIHSPSHSEEERQGGAGLCAGRVYRSAPAVENDVVSSDYSEQDASVALQRLLEVTAGSFEERAQLQHALESRIVIEQAKGMLAERLRLSIDQAFEVLRGASRSSGTKIHAMAARVVSEPETPVEVVASLQRTLERGARGGR